MLREKNDEAVLATQSKLLDAEKAHSADLQNQLSKVQLELAVSQGQRASEVAELESRLKKEAEVRKTLDTKLQNDIRVSMYTLGKILSNNFRIWNRE